MARSATEQTTLRAMLITAIRTTYVTERQLFDEQTHERSIMFHIGRRLAAEVESAGWDRVVDLEYNRQHLDPAVINDPKKMTYPRLIEEQRDESGHVLPDRIVHNRSGATREHNLLVLEAKLIPSPRQRADEYEKLRGYIRQFHYQHAVFLEFPKGGAKPQWCWIDDKDGYADQPTQELF
jgi:hypothetical protein